MASAAVLLTTPGIIGGTGAVTVRRGIPALFTSDTETDRLRLEDLARTDIVPRDSASGIFVWDVVQNPLRVSDHQDDESIDDGRGEGP